MKKVLFICKNIDNRPAEEVNLAIMLNTSGMQVLVHETDLNHTNENLHSIIKDYDLVIISNDEKNGFKPNIVNGNNNIYKQIVFTI